MTTDGRAFVGLFFLNSLAIFIINYFFKIAKINFPDYNNNIGNIKSESNMSLIMQRYKEIEFVNYNMPVNNKKIINDYVKKCNSNININDKKYSNSNNLI